MHDACYSSLKSLHFELYFWHTTRVDFIITWGYYFQFQSCSLEFIQDHRPPIGGPSYPKSNIGVFLFNIIPNFDILDLRSSLIMVSNFHEDSLWCYLSNNTHTHTSISPQLHFLSFHRILLLKKKKLHPTSLKI